MKSDRPTSGPPTAEDWAFQAHSLQRVSRTFALTIPQLGGALERAVGNAYLIFRIADTIEDCPTLPVEKKHTYYESLVDLVAGDGDSESFGEALSADIRDSMTADEIELVANTPAVIRITLSFSEPERNSILRCTGIMTQGMETYQEGLFTSGLTDMPHMSDYCYHVAGVVGEMLTELFCHHSKAIDARRERIEPLSVSFGQGLQMTNILKDIWEDKERNVCWLPRDIFEKHGCSLDHMSEARGTTEFEQGLEQVIAIAHGHLRNALDYTLAIPKSERGVRLFCLWALFMAVSTLAKIHARPAFHTGDDVKITRAQVGRIVTFTKMAAGQDWLLRMAFNFAGRSLPAPHLPTR